MSNVTFNGVKVYPNWTQANSKQQIVSNENLVTSLGKISAWFDFLNPTEDGFFGSGTLIGNDVLDLNSIVEPGVYYRRSDQEEILNSPAPFLAGPFKLFVIKLSGENSYIMQIAIVPFTAYDTPSITNFSKPYPENIDFYVLIRSQIGSGSNTTVWSNWQMFRDVSPINLNQKNIVQLINETSKNILQNVRHSVMEQTVSQNRTFMPLEDGGIFISGNNSSAKAEYYLVGTQSGTTSKMDLSEGSYQASISYMCYDGEVADSTNHFNNIILHCYDKTGAEVIDKTTNVTNSDTGVDCSVKITAVTITVASNVVIPATGIVVYPMICKKDKFDLTTTFQPYLPSYLDLNNSVNNKISLTVGKEITDPDAPNGIYANLFDLPVGKYYRTTNITNTQNLPSGLTSAFYCEIVNTISSSRRKIYLYPSTSTTMDTFYTCTELSSGYSSWYKFTGEAVT